MTITLVGMPAVGKSCMGRAIAKAFNMKLVDGDKVIEATDGRRLQQIMDEEGLEGFKRIEEETLLTIDEDNIVFTPGGSAVYYPSVMERFKEKGIVVYLYASADVISNRLVDFSKRGVVLKPGMTMQDLYNERAPLFEKYADITINCNGTAFKQYKTQGIRKIAEYLNKTGQK
ncbi:MAG: shikimate kinase [Clostridia bacterium]|nr:shikimate kinase [Clostridia bacterium]